MGLGLAICRRLVELHHGSISVESEGLGRGTTVTIELSVIESRSSTGLEQNRQDLFTEDERMPDTRLQSITVLAVDDDADTRRLVKTILERSGAFTTVLGSGKEALDAIKNIRPDVLICDLVMPQMDGYELLKNVRHLEPEVGRFPVIAFTASARAEDRAQTKRAGFRAHLAKPVSPDELVNAVVKVVGQKIREESHGRKNTGVRHGQ